MRSRTCRGCCCAGHKCAVDWTVVMLMMSGPDNDEVVEMTGATLPSSSICLRASTFDLQCPSWKRSDTLQKHSSLCRGSRESRVCEEWLLMFPPSCSKRRLPLTDPALFTLSCPCIPSSCPALPPLCRCHKIPAQLDN